MAGFSLGGFEISDDDDGYGYGGGGKAGSDRLVREVQFPDDGRAGVEPRLLLRGDDRARSWMGKEVYSLEEQIVLTEMRVAALAGLVRGSYGGGGGEGEVEGQKWRLSLWDTRSVRISCLK